MSQQKRPAIVTWLALMVFLLSVVSFLRVYGALTRWSLLGTLELTFSPWGIATFSGFWGLAFLVLAWGLWRVRAWARMAATGMIALHEMMFNVQRVVFARGTYERGRLLFTAGVSVVFVALVVFIVTREKVRRTFTEE